MGNVDHNVIATMLLSTLCFVIVIGIFLVYLVLQWQQKSRKLLALEMDIQSSKETRNPHFQLGLRRPDCWLAIKHRDVMAVQTALALHNSKPCSWLDGWCGEGEQKLFVSAPIAGWILVMGAALPDPSDDVDACFRLLVELSRRLGRVQFFSTNGILNQHAWAQSESGRILRGYAWAGRTLWNQGESTQEELDLKMKCYDYEEIPSGTEFNSSTPLFDNCEKVHLLAARWSVDPEAINEDLIERQWGVLGECSRRF